MRHIFKGIGTIAKSAVGIVKETSDPNSKISSKKSAASLLLFTAIAMVSKEEVSNTHAAFAALFTVGGVFLLYISMRDKK